MSKKVRVRYAPSPTGYLHIGGARSALFNYLYAKKFNGDFVFRIEDTDIERNIEGAEYSQLHDLIWLNIIPDESIEKMNPKYAPYRQMEKLDLYRKYAQELIDKGYAYECYCTPEELEESACIDGCGTFGIFFKIMLPLMMPAISTVAIALYSFAS